MTLNYLDYAYRTADEFLDYYYTILDKDRNRLEEMYTNNPTLLWHYYQMFSKEEFYRYINALPPTYHQLNSMDAQPSLYELGTEETKITIVITGVASYMSLGSYNFCHTIIIVYREDKWLIENDSYRFHGAVFDIE